MHRESELRMLYEGEKPICAVSDPLQDEVLATSGHFGLHERRALPNHTNGIARPLQKTTVGCPACDERLVRVVKEIHVSRPTSRSDHRVERDAAGNVTLPRCDAGLR